MIKALPQRIFFTLFLGIILLGGTGIFHAYWKGLFSYGYAETRCRIITNKFVTTSGGSNHLMLHYTYTFDGQQMESSRYQWGLDEHSNQRTRETRPFVRNNPPGTETTCYVNPNNPHESVMRTGSTTKSYVVFILAIFLIIGLTGFLVAFLRPDLARTYMIMDSDGSSSGSD